MGNLTYDSCENLNPNVDDKVIIPMLKEFSNQLFESKHEVCRVTIGAGEKTLKRPQSAVPRTPGRKIHGRRREKSNDAFVQSQKKTRARPRFSDFFF